MTFYTIFCIVKDCPHCKNEWLLFMNHLLNFLSIWRVRLYFRGNYECVTFIITYLLCVLSFKLWSIWKCWFLFFYCRLYQGLEWIVNNIRNRWWCDYDTLTHTPLKNSRDDTPSSLHQRLKKTNLMANDDIYVCGVLYNSKKADYIRAVSA